MKNFKLNLKGLYGYSQSLSSRSLRPSDEREAEQAHRRVSGGQSRSKCAARVRNANTELLKAETSERRASEEKEPLSSTCLRSASVFTPFRLRYLRYAAMVVLLLTLGVGQAWGDAIAFTGGYVYFDNTNTNWSNVIELVAHQYTDKDYIGATTMSKISGTNNLYYCSNPQGSNWGNIWGWRFMCNETAWGNSDNTDNNVKEYATNYTATTNYGLYSDSYYLCYGASSSKGCALTTSFLGNSNSYTSLNYTQTVYRYVSENGGTPAASTANIATISIATKYLSSANATSDHNVSIASGQSTNNTTAARTATVTMTATSITDGYAFLGWYSAGTGGTLLESSTTYTYQATAAKTVYARFSHETTHSVAITYTCASPSATVSTATNQAIGQVTASSITAPTVAGYTFVNWTLGSGVQDQGSDLTANPISVKTLSSGDYTMQANYTEDLTTTWYINGDADDGENNSPFSGWGTAGTPMYKKSGYSTVEKYYCTITVNHTATGSGWGFKAFNSAGATDSDKYYAANSKSFTIDANSATVTNNNNYPNMGFLPYLTGEYEFELDNTGANPILTIHWPIYNQVRISAASPTDETNTGNYDLSEPVSNVRTVTRSLAANTTYTFKIVYGSDWYGKNSGELTRSTSTSSNTLTDLSTSGDDMTLRTDYAGDYTFKFNQSTKTLSVDFPEAYQITWGVGNIAGNKSAITCKKYDTDDAVVSNSTWILKDDKVTFYAGSNEPGNVVQTGYTWRGYYGDADGLTSQLSYQTGYSPTISSAGMSFYACFYENDYGITPNVDGQGTITANNGWNAHVATKVSFTATPGTGYKFDSWEQRDGALTIESPTNATTNVNATAESTLQANFSPRYAVKVKAAEGSWSADNANLLDGYTVVSSKDVGYSTITLAANTNYEVKVYDRQTSTWYGGAADQNIDYDHSGNEKEYTIATTLSGRSVYVQTAAAGNYTFNWNLTDEKIAVEYPTSWYITSGQNDALGGSFTAEDDSDNDVTGGKFVADHASVTFTATPNTGYNFDGWYTNAECTGGKDATNPKTISDIIAHQTVYAKFTPKAYTVTLTRTGGSGGSASVTATYNQTLPAATMPTAATGYAFMGYYSAENGSGTQFINADGTWIASVEGYTDASKNWIHDGDVTLYAYYKKAEITAIALNATVFDPVEASGEGWVIANPTIEPTPTLPIIICWELQYDNGSPVPEHSPEEYTESDTKPNQVRFSIAGLAAGSYKIKATLRASSVCGGGTELSTREVSFSIASGFTVTILYKDTEGNTIASSTTSPGKATEWTAVTAPDDLFGYTFSTWVLGDGITKHEEDALTKREDFRFEATFNGTLTAQYTKNKYIYLDLSQKFSETNYWDNPYVYFYNGDPWNATDGTGATGHTKYISGHAMTQIGESKIWYFDYNGVSNASSYIAFTWGDKTSHTNFNATDVIFRGDFTEGTPLFVPAVGQTKSTTNGAQYYNKGYWTNYVGDKTGYTVIIYDNSDNELKRQRFTSVNNDMRMTMKAALDLDAATTYKIEILRDNGKYYKNSGTYENGDTNWAYTEDDSKGAILSSAAGSYVFTLNYSPYSSGGTDFELRLTVDYPAAANDFQILYNDNAEWSLGSAHSATWVHPSRIIRARENGVDTISFFVAKGEGISAQLKARKVTTITASTGAITWASLNINGNASQSLTVASAAVYNFKVTQGEAGTIASIENIGAYTGNYYIRSNALNSNWDNYTTDGDHQMTYSSFSESDANSFGEKYSHYKAKWCPRSTNIAFCIANDYSPCITDTLKQDVDNPYGNTDINGTLNNDGDAGHSGNNAYLDRYSANVRFMWNRKTNKISRAYVSAATSGRAKFLVLRANQEIRGTNDAAVSDEGITNGVLFADKENWMYEKTLKIKPGTLFKLFACYAEATPSEANAQYFRGHYAENVWDDANTIVLIGGSSDTYQLARIVYDFKTNRLLAAWMPSGEDISGDNTINADVMIVREHHEPATCITFANAAANLSGVKTVYGVMQFNRWTLNNREHPEDQNKEHATIENMGTYHAPLPVASQKSIYERRLYFISFPFDVRIGDIFGFGQYGQYWVIQYYDGLNRARNGYWIDSESNWKYFSPTEVSQGYTLNANEGYILELNLSAMAADNTTFWSNGISTIELYFPSTVSQETLKQTNITIPALSDEYKCTINRSTPEGDRRVKDSYWRCIGVPSYNLYNSALKDGDGGSISWKTAYTWAEDESEFPFIYVWNKADNTLTPQSTSAFTFQPMHAYLTQIKSAIVWTAVSAKPSSIVARRARKEADNEHEWRIELRQDTTFLDQTYVRMTDMEQVTDSFDFGQDLVKELNSRSNIYTFIGYEKAAANSMSVHSEQTTVVPVGLNIREDGEYTFAMPEGTSGVGVTLIDTEANVRTSLSALDYTVTLAAGQYDSRFFLEISPVQNSATGNLTPTLSQGEGEKVRKVMVDGILYIVRDGKMYDARGVRVE